MVFNESAMFSTGTRLPGDLNGDSIIDVSDVTLNYNNINAFVSVMRP